MDGTISAYFPMFKINNCEVYISRSEVVHLPPVIFSLAVVWHSDAIQVEREIENGHCDQIWFVLETQIAVVTVPQQRPGCGRNRNFDSCSSVQPVVQTFQVMHQVLEKNVYRELVIICGPWCLFSGIKWLLVNSTTRPVTRI